MITYDEVKNLKQYTPIYSINSRTTSVKTNDFMGIANYRDNSNRFYIVLHNTSDNECLLVHVPKDEGNSRYFLSKLDALNYAVKLADQKLSSALIKDVQLRNKEQISKIME